MTTQLIHAMTAAIDDMKKWPAKTVQLFHHNDADGLSSGAILKVALERLGYSIRRYSLEKPYPKVLEKVFQQKGELIVLADFAGRIAPLISDLNQGRNLTRMMLDSGYWMLVYGIYPASSIQNPASVVFGEAVL